MRSVDLIVIAGLPPPGLSFPSRRATGGRSTGGGGRFKGVNAPGQYTSACMKGRLLTALCRLLNVGPVSWSARTSGSTTGFFSDLTIVCLGSGFFHNFQGFLD